jgi:hypothetical protein
VSCISPRGQGAGVALSVGVSVELVGVGHAGAVVAGVAHRVAVGVRVGGGCVVVGAGIAQVGQAVAVAIGVRAALPGGAGVALAVGVRVELVEVGHVRAVVAGIAVRVAVGVGLGRIGHHRAGVRQIRDAVAVLVAGGDGGLAGVAHAIAVGVGLVHVGDGGAGVAGVGHAVAVGVRAVVRLVRARVRRVGAAVAVAVRGRLAHVARAIGVGVGLVGVGRLRAVVAQVAEPVGVRVLLTRVGAGGAVVAVVVHAVVVGVRVRGQERLGQRSGGVGCGVRGCRSVCPVARDARRVLGLTADRDHQHGEDQGTTSTQDGARFAARGLHMGLGKIPTGVLRLLDRLTEPSRSEPDGAFPACLEKGPPMTPDDFRRLALALPEAVEGSTWATPISE